MNTKLTIKLLCIATCFLSTSLIAKPQHQKNLLFVQIAKSAEIQEIENNSGVYKITLNHVEPITSFFTERPNRETGLMTTESFVNNWKELKDLKQSPPNVAIESVDARTKNRINQIFEVMQPSYNARKHQLTYVAKSLAPQQFNLHGSEKMKMNYTVLFIDDFHWDGNKFEHN